MDPATIKMILSGLLTLNKSRKDDVGNQLDTLKQQPLNIVKKFNRGIW